MAKILRGDVFWADLNPAVGHEQAGLRPVVILSRELFNLHSGTVIAMALTSQVPSANYPLTLKLESLQLPKESWAKSARSERSQTNVSKENSGGFLPTNCGDWLMDSIKSSAIN